MKDQSPYTVDLESSKVAFLNDMANRHGLADMGKAIRCLIEYAREHPERHEEIFGEVRCHDC